MSKNVKLELTWVGKDKEVAVEPRILIENKDLSNIEKDENTENMPSLFLCSAHYKLPDVRNSQVGE